ncbi:hypothetical protein Vsou_04830 [Vulcanisaeta souniana JCM 11219]|uniref:Uncharacterized protein n=1 Tax=Vulcanisaeta souniana JCM 11219 TaxID=1293586 RepID=A0ABM8BKA2_9CREN|nr:hypothetical protein Vsou_04830 [Vulcanisaeta souniana JCM 11219]
MFYVFSMMKDDKIETPLEALALTAPIGPFVLRIFDLAGIIFNNVYTLLVMCRLVLSCTWLSLGLGLGI